MCETDGSLQQVRESATHSPMTCKAFDAQANRFATCRPFGQDAYQPVAR